MKYQNVKEEIFENIDKVGGAYFAYPKPSHPLMPPPLGFTPFYVSHYGRHGSRWLLEDSRILRVLQILRRAEENRALTMVGTKALNDLEHIWAMAEHHNGSLTAVGKKQMEDIADRMLNHYPSVFLPESLITARATVIPRVILSMGYFVAEMMRKRPDLYVDMDASDKFMSYLCNHSEESWKFKEKDAVWQEEKRKFIEGRIDSERFIKSLFSDNEFIYKYVNPQKFMVGFYWITVDLQNIETDISFYPLFTKDELYGIWEGINYSTYVMDGPSPLNHGLVTNDAKPLAQHILDKANLYIRDKKTGATLRFGHDSNITALIALLHIEGFDAETTHPAEVAGLWQTYNASPMAANLQLIFYKNTAGNVLVKLLYNEKETKLPIRSSQFPYYEWEDVKKHLQNVIVSN